MAAKIGPDIVWELLPAWGADLKPPIANMTELGQSDCEYPTFSDSKSLFTDAFGEFLARHGFHNRAKWPDYNLKKLCLEAQAWSSKFARYPHIALDYKVAPTFFFMVNTRRDIDTMQPIIEYMSTNFDDLWKHIRPQCCDAPDPYLWVATWAPVVDIRGLVYKPHPSDVILPIVSENAYEDMHHLNELRPEPATIYGVHVLRPSTSGYGLLSSIDYISLDPSMLIPVAKEILAVMDPLIPSTLPAMPPKILFDYPNLYDSLYLTDIMDRRNVLSNPVEIIELPNKVYFVPSLKDTYNSKPHRDIIFTSDEIRHGRKYRPSDLALEFKSRPVWWSTLLAEIRRSEAAARLIPLAARTHFERLAKETAGKAAAKKAAGKLDRAGLVAGGGAGARLSLGGAGPGGAVGLAAKPLDED